MTELVVDQLGRRCPLPVIELARRIVDVPVDGLVVVLADDPAAGPDIRAWCTMRGHAYEGERVDPRGPAFVVRRQPARS